MPRRHGSERPSPDWQGRRYIFNIPWFRVWSQDSRPSSRRHSRRSPLHSGERHAHDEPRCDGPHYDNFHPTYRGGYTNLPNIPIKRASPFNNNWEPLRDPLPFDGGEANVGGRDRFYGCTPTPPLPSPPSPGDHSFDHSFQNRQPRHQQQQQQQQQQQNYNYEDDFPRRQPPHFPHSPPSPIHSAYAHSDSEPAYPSSSLRRDRYYSYRRDHDRGTDQDPYATRPPKHERYERYRGEEEEARRLYGYDGVPPPAPDPPTQDGRPWQGFVGSHHP